MNPKITWDLANTRIDTFKKLKSANPHLVYFYCHGGFQDGITTSLRVGAKNEQGWITPDNFQPYDIYWDRRQPLVFINGCQTAAIQPKLMLDFVSRFIAVQHAAGVVGTEITVFESLARVFAEECLRRFLVGGETIGESVRATRLKLLQQGNPLGLVYTVYANASLRLKKTFILQQ